MIYIRSLIFTLSFYVITFIMCIICLPTAYMPRPIAMRTVGLFVNTVYVLERVLLGLDYEVRGLEHLPKSGSFLVAAKHQSAYETMKLHIIFDDPAIILKRELLSIPLWGRFLSRIDPIAINRKSRKQATQQVIDGSLRVKMQGRPIVIFPQGTRVPVELTSKEKPYKYGIAKMQEASELTIIPMALNSGYFWPRNHWLKRPGKAVFEFLPPVAPGMSAEDLMKKLEHDLESASLRLLDEARSKG